MSVYVCVCGGGGSPAPPLILPSGGTLIFLYIRRLESIFGVKNFEFQYLFGFSEK